jgi:hypothetical protein
MSHRIRKQARAATMSAVTLPKVFDCAPASAQQQMPVARSSKMLIDRGRSNFITLSGEPLLVDAWKSTPRWE